MDFVFSRASRNIGWQIKSQNQRTEKQIMQLLLDRSTMVCDTIFLRCAKKMPVTECVESWLDNWLMIEISKTHWRSVHSWCRIKANSKKKQHNSIIIRWSGCYVSDHQCCSWKYHMNGDYVRTWKLNSHSAWLVLNWMNSRPKYLPRSLIHSYLLTTYRCLNSTTIRIAHANQACSQYPNRFLVYCRCQKTTVKPHF